MINLFLLLAFERSTLKCKSNLVKNSKNLQKKIFYMRHSINFEPFFQASFSKLNYIMCSDIILITNHQHFLKNIISFHCSTWQNAQMKVNLCQIIEFLLKKNLAFECATFKCQEQEQVCQWILLVPTFVKPLEKVWSEDAWELTFHSPVKTANLDKNTSEKSFSWHFVKKGSDIWSIFLHFFITSIKNLTWIQLSHYMGRNLC